MTPLEDAIRVCGSASALAADIRAQGHEISNSTPGMWKQRGLGNKVPAEFCPAIEAATAARGECIPCERLNPGVAWHIVRAKPATVPAAAQAGNPAPAQGYAGPERRGKRQPRVLAFAGRRETDRAAKAAAEPATAEG